MKEYFLKHKYSILLIIPGIIGGFLYWKYIGCTSGTCAIKSNWQSMVPFGGLTGYFVGDIIDDIITKKKSKKDDI